MTSTPVFYPLLFAALVSLCLLIHVWWPDPLTVTPPPVKPVKPRRKRSKAPKPFAGYLQKPLCEACEHGLDSRPKAPDSPPPLIRFNRGRKRTVDTSGHFCPDPDCAYHGRLGLGNIRANGHPGGQPWRQFQCVSCQGYFYETHGTIFHGKRSSPDLIVHVIACLAEDFLPFVNPNLTIFLPHLGDRLPTNPDRIIAGTIPQHSHQDTQQSVTNIA